MGPFSVKPHSRFKDFLSGFLISVYLLCLDAWLSTETGACIAPVQESSSACFLHQLKNEKAGKTLEQEEHQQRNLKHSKQEQREPAAEGKHLLGMRKHTVKQC